MLRKTHFGGHLVLEMGDHVVDIDVGKRWLQTDTDAGIDGDVLRILHCRGCLVSQGSFDKAESPMVRAGYATIKYPRVEFQPNCRFEFFWG